MTITTQYSSTDFHVTARYDPAISAKLSLSVSLSFDDGTLAQFVLHRSESAIVLVLQARKAVSTREDEIYSHTDIHRRASSIGMRARTLVAILAAVGVGAHLTKPHSSTFDSFFQKWMQKQLSEADEGSRTTNIVRWFNNRIGSFASALTSALSQVRL